MIARMLVAQSIGVDWILHGASFCASDFGWFWRKLLQWIIASSHFASGLVVCFVPSLYLRWIIVSPQECTPQRATPELIHHPTGFSCGSWDEMTSPSRPAGRKRLKRWHKKQLRRPHHGRVWEQGSANQQSWSTTRWPEEQLSAAQQNWGHKLRSLDVNIGHDPGKSNS